MAGLGKNQTVKIRRGTADRKQTVHVGKRADKGPKRRRVKFGFRAEPGSLVALAGTFNGWNPEQMFLKDKTGRGDFERTVLLEPGRYEYKFVVDGVWHPDPENPNWVHNEFGTLNSIIEL